MVYLSTRLSLPLYVCVLYLMVISRLGSRWDGGQKGSGIITDNSPDLLLRRTPLNKVTWYCKWGAGITCLTHAFWKYLSFWHWLWGVYLALHTHKFTGSELWRLRAVKMFVLDTELLKAWLGYYQCISLSANIKLFILTFGLARLGKNKPRTAAGTTASLLGLNSCCASCEMRVKNISPAHFITVHSSLNTIHLNASFAKN